MRAYASCDHLTTSSSLLVMKKDMASVGPPRGKVVEVYDGRKWPVVRCGSVYVSADDTTQKVTQTAVTSTAIAEKKRRASKYTLAVGTSHGHVQAFLDDADNVLTTLDQCQAEEKCLMLIKRPKESAKKMLKSQSLSNLSVSDPQLHRQFNGLQLTQVHQHAQTVDPPHQDQPGTDGQSVAPGSSSQTEPRRRYISAREKNWRHQLNPGATSTPRSSACCQNDTCPDYQYVPRRDRDCHRRGLRYSSIPEDEDQEINNNSSKGSSPTNNGHEPPSSMPTNGCNRSDRPQQGQGYHVPGQFHEQRQGYDQPVNGQLYNPHGQRNSEIPVIHDPGDSEHNGRPGSMSSFSAGLTLSVVGQRKAESVAGSPSVSYHQHPPPPVQSPRHLRNEGVQYGGAMRSPDDLGKSPRHRYPGNTHPSRPNECDEVYSSRQYNGHCNGVHSPSYGPYQNGVQPGYSMTTDGQRRSLPNGYGGYDSSSSISREESSQCMEPPPKPKRSMQLAPVNETSERLKRFTEVMRSRISSSSNADNSSGSSMSQTPTAPHTPPSRHSSLTQNGWDSEVSTLLEVRLAPGSDSPSHKLSSERTEGLGVSSSQQDARDKDRLCEDRRGPDHQYALTNPSSSQELYVDPHSDCGQSSYTSHSHSSTMDSGYTTNTEGDGDSSVNIGHQFSPPYRPIYPHLHIGDPAHHSHILQISAEPYRPVPLPRNLSLVPARKYNSIPNGDTTLTTFRPSCHTENSQDAKDNQKSSTSTGAQSLMNQSQTSEHQRRSWDSAHSFKSLDFTPVNENVQVGTGSPACDDLVVKPQAVTITQTTSLRSCVKQEESSSSKRSENTGKHKGQSKEDSKSRQEQAGDDTPDSNNVIVVSGNWNNNTNNGNVINNNNDINSNSTVNNNNTSSPRTLTKPHVHNTPTPTLFQLSQSYDLCSVKLSLPGALSVSSLLTLETVQITLPTLNLENGSAACQSPYGCARIGGPGSAFRPVKMAGNGQTMMELTAVASTDKQCEELTTMGQLSAGDLVLEVNGWQCAGSDVDSLQTVMEGAQAEVTLVVARKKEEPTDNQVQQLENSVQKLETEVQRLNNELSERDLRIQELSAMLQWRKDDQTGETALILESDDGPFVIGENEFVV